MIDKKVALPFTIEEQIEIERIAIDKDKESALEFVKKLDEELKRRETAHCGIMFDWTPDTKVAPPEITK